MGGGGVLKGTSTNESNLCLAIFLGKIFIVYLLGFYVKNI